VKHGGKAVIFISFSVKILLQPARIFGSLPLIRGGLDLILENVYLLRD